MLTIESVPALAAEAALVSGTELAAADLLERDLAFRSGSCCYQLLDMKLG